MFFCYKEKNDWDYDMNIMMSVKRLCLFLVGWCGDLFGFEAIV